MAKLPAIVIMSLTLLALLLGCTSTPGVPRNTAIVAVGSSRLWVQTAGVGSPTVVFEAGLDEDASTWNRVAPRLSAETSTVVYSRAGLGRSSKPAAVPRTSRQIADDLHALLSALGTKGPLVMVAHSIGALTARVYAGAYPQDVAGMVLVDGSHPDQWTEMLSALPKETEGEQRGISTFRKTMTSLLNDSTFNREHMDIAASAAEARSFMSLGDLPLVVVTRSPQSHANPMLAPPVELTIEDIHQALQASYLRLSTSSSQVIAARAGHRIQNEEPQLVIDAVLKVLEEVRARAR